MGDNMQVCKFLYKCTDFNVTLPLHKQMETHIIPQNDIPSMTYKQGKTMMQKMTKQAMPTEKAHKNTEPLNLKSKHRHDLRPCNKVAMDQREQGN